jgi:hypothetical protein
MVVSNDLARLVSAVPKLSMLSDRASVSSRIRLA